MTRAINLNAFRVFERAGWESEGKAPDYHANFRQDGHDATCDRWRED
jgi:hypothetical protein